jgi:hypothetical protein
VSGRVRVQGHARRRSRAWSRGPAATHGAREPEAAPAEGPNWLEECE